MTGGGKVIEKYWRGGDEQKKEKGTEKRPVTNTGILFATN